MDKQGGSSNQPSGSKRPKKEYVVGQCGKWQERKGVLFGRTFDILPTIHDNEEYVSQQPQQPRRRPRGTGDWATCSSVVDYRNLPVQFPCGQMQLQPRDSSKEEDEFTKASDFIRSTYPNLFHYLVKKFMHKNDERFKIAILLHYRQAPDHLATLERVYKYYKK